MLEGNGYGPLGQGQLHDVLSLVSGTHPPQIFISIIDYWRNYSPNSTATQVRAYNVARASKSRNKYNLMRSSKAAEMKHKKAKSGNSEFTRAKLEDEYEPKVRFFKGNVMTMMDIPDQEKHENKSKEEAEICSKAIHTIKQGYSIKIDWSTRTNFRTTKSLLPKLKTEPAHNISVTEVRPKKIRAPNTIQQRQAELSRLLFIRHKKKYMVTKRQQEEEMKLFGESRIRHTTSPHSMTLKNPQQHLNRSETKKVSPKLDKSIMDVQEELLSKSKLTVLKEELKSKFFEIRQSFTKKQKFKKHLFLNLREVTDSNQ